MPSGCWHSKGMRKARLLIPESLNPGGAYHVVSRVVDRQLVLGQDEKERLVWLMRRYERFCGVKVLTYCIMGNHFHWLVEVPNRPADANAMPDEDIVARVAKCQGKMAAAGLKADLAAALKAGNATLHSRIRERWLSRMWNLSAFVQSVKQRFSVWFNKQHQRKGTMWEERFKSVVALGPQAIASVAAYIDLNPVRAGLVDDPKDYAWSGYAEAVTGGKAARSGLKQALCGREGGMLAKNQGDYLEWYRCWICGRGVEGGIRADGEPLRRGVSREVAQKVHEAERGRLAVIEVLKTRVRHFSDGLAVGASALLATVFEERRDYFSANRTTGPRKMRWGDWGDLRALRDLQRP